MSRFSKYLSYAGRMKKSRLLKTMFVLVNRNIYLFFRKLLVKNRNTDLDSTPLENFKPTMSFLFDSGERECYIRQIRSLNKEKDILEQADRICSHIFNLLGTGERCFGGYIPWNEDFKTGFVWENTFYKDIEIINFNNSSDVKLPWELSRFQHVPTLGKAYLITGDPKYAVEFKNEIQDWISQNPLEMSVNWTCTMDVAIRACNWIAGYYFFKDSCDIEKEFWDRFNKELYRHGKFIFRNLENKGLTTNNHYLSDIAGMIWLGLYFKGFHKGPVIGRLTGNYPDNWLKTGLQELEREMKKQINDDGTDFEASTSYHCLVTELYLYTTILCRRNGIEFPEYYMNKLQVMVEFIMNITKPNGLIPLIGDMDGGRFIIFANYGSEEKRCFMHLARVAGEFFDRDDFRHYGGEEKEETVWCMGGFKEPAGKQGKLKSIGFRQGGYYILRNDRAHLVIRCGELSMRGFGGHSHNDQLSIEFNLDGIDFLVDPGTYVYTADYKMRNLFRSTEYHNTLQVEELQQNDFNERDIFLMNNETGAEMVSFGKDYFKGRHYGYKDKAGVIHERAIKLEKDRLVIEDRLIYDKTISGPYRVSRYFHVPDEISPVNEQQTISLSSGKTGITIETPGVSEVKRGYISPAYGVKKTGYIIKILNEEAPEILKTTVLFDK